MGLPHIQKIFLLVTQKERQLHFSIFYTRTLCNFCRLFLLVDTFFANNKSQDLNRTAAEVIRGTLHLQESKLRNKILLRFLKLVAVLSDQQIYAKFNNTIIYRNKNRTSITYQHLILCALPNVLLLYTEKERAGILRVI